MSLLNLASERCAACRPGAPAATLQEQAEWLAALPGWSLREENGMPVLVRLYRCQDFSAALACAQAIGALADAADHHPRLVVEWGRLEVSWWTHVIAGLHRNDFIMAARTETAVAAHGGV